MARRVVIVTPWGERLGGAEEMLWLLLTHLDRERLEPTVVFLGEGPFEEEVRGLGIETETIPTGRLRQPGAVLAAIRQLGRVLRSRRPAVVMSWSAKAHLYAAPAALATGARGRLVWWQHTTPEGHWMDRIATLLPARAIGCSSEAGRQSQAELWPGRPCFVVNPGIEVGEPAADDPGLRAGLGIPAGRPVVGIVGRLQPNKGQDRFLRALAAVRDAGRDAHGLVVGGDAHDLSPEFVPELEGLVRGLGLEGAVTMTGQVDDARPYFELMDIAVNASDQESFPLTLMEAMAAGAAVVSVGRDGRRDMVETGVTGILTETGEPAELAEAVGRLLDDEGRRAEIVAAAREAALERFGAGAMSERMADRLIEVADA